MTFIEHEILQHNWFFYGIVLMVSIPLLVVIVNEVIYHTNRKKLSLSVPLGSIKNFIIPLVALIVVMSQVLEFPSGSMMMKLLETLTWILVINVCLSIINILFFSSAGLRKNKAQVPQLFLDIFRVVLVIVGAVIVLSAVWGADLGGLVTALGLSSFIFGLALQDTLGNLFSGIALVYEKPFTEGDFIEVKGHTGKVVEMNWRAIRLETLKKELIVIPHLVIGRDTIKNYSQPSKIHIMKTQLGFLHQNPPNKVKETLLNTCLFTPGILHDPKPQVKTDHYTELKMMYEVEFAIGDFKYHEEIMDDLKTRVWYTARRHGLWMSMSQVTIQNRRKIKENERQKLSQLESSLKQLPDMLPIEKTNVDKLMNGSAIHFFGRGEVIIRQGDLAGTLYVILDGRAVVETQTNEGQKVVINELGKGDFFGEVALFTTKFSSFSVTAMEDLQVITIFYDEVMEMVELNPRLGQHLDEIMDARRMKVEN